MTTSGVAPSVDTCSTIGQHLERERAALGLDEPAHRVGGALAHLPAVAHVHARHAGLGGERHQHGVRVLDRSSSPKSCDGELDDRATLGRLVGERRHQCALGELALGRRRDRDELGRLARAVGDRAGLVEQQRRARRRPPRRRGRTSPARCAARAGPCRRCRSPTAGRRSSSGSGTPAGRRAR